MGPYHYWLNPLKQVEEPFKAVTLCKLTGWKRNSHQQAQLQIGDRGIRSTPISSYPTHKKGYPVLLLSASCFYTTKKYANETRGVVPTSVPCSVGASSCLFGVDGMCCSVPQERSQDKRSLWST